MIPASQHPALRRPGFSSWCVLAAAAGLACWPLMAGPVLPRGSDVSFHAQWARGFVQALDEGQLYPRWVAEANHGFGAPVFLMYPPLSYYAVALANLATGDLIEALRLVLIGASFLAGAAFFAAARPVSSEAGAAFGAALYVLLPYRALDLYDRFALGEVVAFVWFPLLFAAVRRLGEGPSARAGLLLAGSYAGLVLTHLVTAFMALFVLAPYALVRARRTGSWRRLAPMLGAGAAGLALAGVFLVPLLVARPHVHVGGMVEKWFDWWRNFVYMDKSVPGFPRDPVKPWVDGSATTQALLTLAAAVVLALRSAVPFPHPPAPSPAPAEEGSGVRAARAALSRKLAPVRPVGEGARVEGWTHVGLAAFAFFLQTWLSTPLWQVVPQLAEVQFPWRFSAFQMLAACFACACALAPLGSVAAAVPAGGKRAQRRREARKQASAPRASALSSPALALGALALAALPALYFTARVTAARPYDFDRSVAESPLYRYRFAKEFLPRIAGDWKRLAGAPPGGPRAALDGPGRVEELLWAGHERRLRVEAPAAARLELKTFAFRGWHAWLDGQEVPIRAAPPHGSIQIEVPPGSHEVLAAFMPTWDRRLGAALSGLSAAGLILWTLRERRRRSGNL